MNTEVDNITFDDAVERCCELASGSRQGNYVVTPNVDHIVQLEKDDELRVVYRDADLILADGKPLIWISKGCGSPIKEKISGSDLFPALCSECSKLGLTMYFFGAAPGVAQKAADNLTAKFPGLRVVGTMSPDYGFERDSKKVDEAISQSNEAAPDILVVGLGCPKQEKFIHHYRDRIHAKLMLGLGASLDFEAGNVTRAPEWMQRCGLEWLYRITQDPTRLAKRYLVDDLKIVPLIFKYRKVGR